MSKCLSGPRPAGKLRDSEKYRAVQVWRAQEERAIAPQCHRCGILYRRCGQAAELIALSDTPTSVTTTTSIANAGEEQRLARYDSCEVSLPQAILPGRRHGWASKRVWAKREESHKGKQSNCERVVMAVVERWQAWQAGGVGSWRGKSSQVGLAYLARWQSKMHDVLYGDLR